jgi:ABC-2 type transport system permease protein
MNYPKQLITVTLWEFRRFFKPRNEAIGILIMLLISGVFYFAGKFAFSDSGEKPELMVFKDADSTLIRDLSSGFIPVNVEKEEKASLLKTISDEKKWILLETTGESFTIHAYKNTRDLKKLRTILNAFHQQREMEKAGLDHEELNAILSGARIVESYTYHENSKSRVLLAIIFAGLMILAVFLSFAYQFTAITGEKQLKITEQIVSAIRPRVWMDGKILGITLTGISSMVLWALLGIAGGTLFFQFTGRDASAILEYLDLPSVLLYLPFAITGILVWNAILAAIASVITDPNNSGKSSLMLLPVLFVAASFVVIRDPDSAMSLFLSWFPLTAATAMPMRWAITEVAFWQVAGSFILLALTFYGLRILAAKIFRVSVLISGKEPTWGEVIKMIRES